MLFKASSGLVINTIHCAGSHQTPADNSITPPPDTDTDTVYGGCTHCRQTLPIGPDGTVIGHDEPLRLIVYPCVAGGAQWTSYGSPWHPAELTPIPIEIAAELAWQHEAEILMTFHGGNEHHAVTDLLHEAVRRWLSVHLSFVEQWTQDRDIIDLVPASQAHLLPVFSPLTA
ncbi:hypothetical protein AB0A74_26545 [Saccharothrix sp. NPDC042600]|uniref:hypothetical protein n=1 Tax=Saccharothrix TaxID=2071 RepID=UPI0033F2DDBB|nr:hypothetical protein GCM10017745_46490 [Saccharothrix mutabilis subsp. capreolus]